MSEGALFEKSLCMGGRVFHFIPSEYPLTIPFGINRGRRWLRGAANAPEWMGLYEWGKQRALRRLVVPGATVCDIGANAGFYTLGLSRLVGPAGRVLAFEPLPRNLVKIRRHLSLNAVANVSLHACALADGNGAVRFVEGADDFTGRIAEGGAGLEVDSRRLDDFLRQHSLGDPALLKIDVEGAEARVLAGARELLTRARPVLLLALHGSKEREECFDLLRALDYRFFDLAGRPVQTASALPDEIISHA